MELASHAEKFIERPMQKPVPAAPQPVPVENAPLNRVDADGHASDNSELKNFAQVNFDV